MEGDAPTRTFWRLRSVLTAAIALIIGVGAASAFSFDEGSAEEADEIPGRPASTRIDSTSTASASTGQPPTIDDLQHEIIPQSQAQLTWTTTNATTLQLFTHPTNQPNDDPQPIGDTLPGTTTQTTIPIPEAARQTITLCATTEPFPPTCQHTTLTNVVTTNQDWDPYDLEGFTPETPIPGSLRSILQDAPPNTTIGFANDITEIEVRGVDLLQLAGSGWQDAHFILTKDVTISGPPGGVTLRGTSAAGPGDPGDPFTYRSRMIYVSPGTTVHLDRVIITGGTFIYRGGGVRNDGMLTITRSRISENRAWFTGGGIWNTVSGVLVVEDSVLEGNRAVTEIDEIGATYAIRGGYVICMIRDAYGGGLFNQGDATFIDTPIRDNEATVDGGGIYNEGTLRLIRSPVSANRADHTVYTADPAYPAPPDFVDHPVCRQFDGPFAPTSQGGGLYQAVGAVLETDASPVTGNLVNDVFVAVASASIDELGAPTSPATATRSGVPER